MSFDEAKHLEQLRRIYRKAFEDVLRVIIEKDIKGSWSRYHRDVLIDIQRIMLLLDDRAQDWIDDAVARAYWASAENTGAYLVGMGLVARQAESPAFAQLHKGAIDVIAQNMTGNLRNAHQFVGRTVDDIFRRVALEQAARKMSSGATIRDMRQQVIDQLTVRGLPGFRDRAGRLWRLDTYADMVARTTTREAASVAVLNQCEAFGVDLVKVTEHSPTCHLCAPIQGKVFSRSGKDGGYPELSSRVTPPIHPNCRHVLAPYIRELDQQADQRQRHSNTSLEDDPRSPAEIAAYQAEQRLKADQLQRKKQRARPELTLTKAPDR